MKNNVMNLPLSVIEEAITGDRESIDTIIEQYSMLIKAYSTRKVAGTNEYRLDSYIEVELIAAILKFEIRR
ncbi:helix-turn-helix domain-containing protein [Enterococcus cecorum]|uniref:helix-turn-helix domain-containing protein n=1 Tax=Enterococcus cecorum TaxID=44008 RepID=UPI001FAD0F3E|nr:helix-turn-helix domain-containing protein [Enterococcus cecorum]MCJ0537673.1 helix-turn-helix domain-containing protein [Enterococcus cecorum]MCJ0547207.1 helix-turn-helix domain-containing protein [Enterococcus cecorum]MCJ0551907.1 helix-turn-helix domain-containing protein [Enterococcus cecorum]MCJ0570476.1 helix-turn-helix domain-containing protein [Enterococcus cecorum]